ncbi:MAG: CBS domain-containing protein [Candidatus Nitrospinota bacterium M3_3B_026]
MHVGQVMSRKVVTASPETKVEKAFGVIVSKRIGHLPVLRRGRLAGIVSDRDFRMAMNPARSPKSGRAGVKNLAVKDIMTKDVITTEPGMAVSDAVKLMLRAKIGALPVMTGDRLSGIVTKDDLLGVFVEMLRWIQASSTIDVELVDEIDDLQALFSTLRERKARVLSYSATPGGASRGQICHIRMTPCAVKPIVGDLARRGVTVLDAYGEDT